MQGAGLLNQQFAHSACYPFYKDHTSFGASMAFLIPPLAVMLFSEEERHAGQGACCRFLSFSSWPASSCHTAGLPG
ncbi:MAG: hypothetical protein MZV63_67065 [Marinilabiliales bacterium]|nr:hypothetical protein [Marinilabiliales bacterium]